ncbi:uncharacterized protein EI90DRAFT_3281873 [Cantharellus anzutake]|uniref:uncharacterized protein n=1 Tax=Cantharellus anzutake TaxID=1750568 RepID=UPI001908000E|nr:uncharacterized protein EI90DRAFT_3281873 [Cantharellus anzutake]KAF8325197.1 hypothetical protein EI90DRAFT_3281873 [Cantharellus anzutake]
MASRALLVDVHTHLYLPRYASLLRQRTAVPLIKSRSDGDRLVILENEPSGGRPVGPQYWDRDQKLAFMDKHNIDISVVSTANPWLDFLSPSEATSMAQALNEDLDDYCATGPNLSLSGSATLKRLYGLGLLPLVPRVSTESVLDEIDRIAALPHLRGLIMGTRGLGKGLDDAELEPIWARVAEKRVVIFLHPHYGVGPGVWGEKDNGHVLPLALGFPFETTVATTRLILAGVFDRHPELKLLLAHSGGALPQLSSRLASCIVHDPVVASRLKHDARWYLGKLYFDAVAYGSEELDFVSSTVSRAVRYDTHSSESLVGSSHMMFGTDHPFFPPIDAEKGMEKWMSVVENLKAIDDVGSWSDAEKDGVKGSNALNLFGIQS